jgi:hypothetical protein
MKAASTQDIAYLPYRTRSQPIHRDHEYGKEQICSKKNKEQICSKKKQCFL